MKTFVLAALVALYAIPATFAGETPMPGEKGYICGKAFRNDGGFVTFVCVDDSAWDKLMVLQGRQDLDEIRIMGGRGQVVMARYNTEVKCLERSFTAIKVRLLAGNHAGAEGWVEKEYVSTTSDNPPPPESSPASTAPPPPEPKPVDRVKRAENQIRLAQSLERQGKTKGAIEFYMKVIKDDDKSLALAPSVKISKERLAVLQR